mmetsp:Transcript_66653/g.124430  ORF Transcript_66653/g.124430 Transcript_66653/m.124430 type:complete len:179 (-) Transcript_66653:29-565(-)
MRVLWTSGVIWTVVLAQGDIALIPESVHSRHCLLQTDANKLSQTVDAVSAQTEVAYRELHAQKALLEANANSAQSAEEAESVALHRPDGPAFMNRTLMSEKTLPEGSRHINMKTFITDWRDEYVQPPDAAPASSYSRFPKLPVVSSLASRNAVIVFLVAVVCLFLCSCVWSHTEHHHT